LAAKAGILASHWFKLTPPFLSAHKLKLEGDIKKRQKRYQYDQTLINKVYEMSDLYNADIFLSIKF
jgi:hypothetical protein